MFRKKPVFNDGSEFIHNWGKRQLIVAPISTTITTQWTPEFNDVFDKLRQHDINPAGWFIPTADLLIFAVKRNPEIITSKDIRFWTSNELSEHSALMVDFYSMYWDWKYYDINTYRKFKKESYAVRAFKFQ